MADREKVIGHLNDCIAASRPDNTWVFVRKVIVGDAISLLKMQEAVEPEWHDGTPFCGNCGRRLEKKNRNMDGINCPSCGKAVKWDD